MELFYGTPNIQYVNLQDVSFYYNFFAIVQWNPKPQSAVTQTTALAAAAAAAATEAEPTVAIVQQHPQPEAELHHQINRRSKAQQMKAIHLRNVASKNQYNKSVATCSSLFSKIVILSPRVFLADHIIGIDFLL